MYVLPGPLSQQLKNNGSDGKERGTPADLSAVFISIAEKYHLCKYLYFWIGDTVKALILTCLLKTRRYQEHLFIRYSAPDDSLLICPITRKKKTKTNSSIF